MATIDWPIVCLTAWNYFQDLTSDASGNHQLASHWVFCGLEPDIIAISNQLSSSDQLGRKAKIGSVSSCRETKELQAMRSAALTEF